VFAARWQEAQRRRELAVVMTQFPEVRFRDAAGNRAPVTPEPEALSVLYDCVFAFAPASLGTRAHQHDRIDWSVTVTV